MHSLREMVRRSVLIIGEGGVRPWSTGPSSERLWRWFGVKTHDELKRKATLMNVFENRGVYAYSLKHFMELNKAIKESDIVVLVGRVAQDFPRIGRFRDVLWRHGKYIGVPHPSGLNRQLNTLSDDEMAAYLRRELRR